MKILMAASEMVPFAKTGGMADAVGALSKALGSLGHDVFCVIPYYRSVAETVRDARSTGAKLTVPVGIKQVSADVLEARLEPRIRLFFVRRDEYFDRSQLYRIPERDYEDNAERFIFFSKAVVSLRHTLKLAPDIVHCHDWQTALVPVFLRWAAGQPASARVLPTGNLPKTVFTIHNLAYQGLFWAFDFPMTNLPNEYFTPETLEFYGHLNCMKGGILFSDIVTTVSKKYAQEIQTPQFGFGLETVLQKRRESLFGILNGVDYSEWNPETDIFIKQRYGPRDLSGKRVCKRDLLETFGLPTEYNGPLIGIVTRLTDQKGIDLIAEGMEALMHRDLKLVVLGSGESNYEEFFRRSASHYPKKLGVRIGFDNALAHKIEAGSDMFLMPSRFEPCGLNQMYSLKYGTIPIVRATGGLDDTVEDYNPRTGQGNGFKFAAYETAEMLETIDRALRTYASAKRWAQLQRNAMACDFSWQVSARQYVELYDKLLKQSGKEA